MDLIKTKEKDIQKLTSYILKTIETNHHLPPVVTYYGSVLVSAKHDDGIFLPHEVHFVLNVEKWYSLPGKVPKNLKPKEMLNKQPCWFFLWRISS